TVHFLAAALLGTILLGIAVTDARHYLIPDEYNWAGLILGLGASLTSGVPGFTEAVLGAATGFALLYAVGVAGQWVFGEEAKGGSSRRRCSGASEWPTPDGRGAESWWRCAAAMQRSPVWWTSSCGTARTTRR